jgi:hypothetical protein
LARLAEPFDDALRPGAMSNLARAAALAALVVVVVACASSAPSGSAKPSTAPSAGSSSPPSPSPSTGGVGAIEHATGATDVVLRLEEGGGFVAPSFLATRVPIFTLYGDGTIIFRNPMKEGPPPVGDIFRFGPLRTARLSEDQIQATLLRAIGEGGLGTARPNYENNMVADASTTIFTVNAGGLHKTVSVYALGMVDDKSTDALPRAAFAKLATALGDFDQGGTIPTQVFAPDRYRGILLDGGPGAPNAIKWPWTDLKPADFVAPVDPNSFQLPVRVLTPAQVAALGVDQLEGGLQGPTLIGPDGKFYSFSLRPLLPDDVS